MHFSGNFASVIHMDTVSLKILIIGDSGTGKSRSVLIFKIYTVIGNKDLHAHLYFSTVDLLKKKNALAFWHFFKP